MKTIHLQALATLALCVSVGGCEANKSRNPLSPTVAGPIAGVTITAPKPLEPVNNQTLTQTGAVTLLIENASTTGERPIWLQVEIASDGGFQNKVHIADKVSPGSNGRTSYQVNLPAAGARYYWHVRALDGANTGEFSATASFVLNDPVHLAIPTVAYPAIGATIDTVSPDLTVTNGAISGSLAGPVSYRFDIATDSGFAQMVAVLTVPRSGGSTTATRLTALAYNTVYYWRVSASDGVVQSPLGPTWSFRTPAAAATPTPTPPAPTPTPPHAVANAESCTGTGTGTGTGSQRRRTRAQSGAGAAAPVAEHGLGGRGSGAPVPRRPAQFLPIGRGHVGIHGPRRRSASAVRHALGLQRQAWQQQRSIPGRGRLQLGLGPRRGHDQRLHHRCDGWPLREQPVAGVDRPDPGDGEQRHDRPLDRPRPLLTHPTEGRRRHASCRTSTPCPRRNDGIRHRP